MKNTWKSSVLLIGTAMLGAVALSGTNVMAGVLDVEVTVDIVNSTVETNPTPLHFGNINADPAGDVITLEAAGAAFSAGISNGAITYTGNSVLSGSPTAGVIHIASTLDLNVDVDYPSDPVTLSGSPGNTTVLTVTAIDAHSGAGATGIYNHTSDPGGADIFVGGVLNIPAGAQTDTYEGVIPVTINYQ